MATQYLIGLVLVIFASPLSTYQLISVIELSLRLLKLSNYFCNKIVENMAWLCGYGRQLPKVVFDPKVILHDDNYTVTFVLRLRHRYI